MKLNLLQILSLERGSGSRCPNGYGYSDVYTEDIFWPIVRSLALIDCLAPKFKLMKK